MTQRRYCPRSRPQRRRLEFDPIEVLRDIAAIERRRLDEALNEDRGED